MLGSTNAPVHQFFMAGDRARTGSSLWRFWPAPALLLVQNVQPSLVMSGPGSGSKELSLQRSERRDAIHLTRGRLQGTGNELQSELRGLPLTRV